MTTGQLQIHSENILPIIKRWLYSEKDIFIRELISNACDAIHKVKILRDQGETDAKDESFRIDVTIDEEAKTITFSDTGIGMTSDEVERYIAQIAFSGAEEFVEKFKEKGDSDQIIGHFGLGFFSSYMAADIVQIDTLSFKQGAEPAFWSCDGSSEYTLEKGKREQRGTSVILHVNKESEEFLQTGALRAVLSRYCQFLPYPIYLNDDRINPEPPLWVKAPSECEKQDYLDFYRALYPFEQEPLFWVHLNVDYPFNLKGILYFPKMKKDFEPPKNNISLYCNRVFVSDNCKDLLPEFLLTLKGAIDSPDIPLNVSRSSLQSDRTVRQVASHIAKKVADSLVSLFNSDRERFVSVWEDVEIVTKLGAFEDAKFADRVKNILIWKNTEGEWTTIAEYLDRNGEKTGDKIYYTNGDRGSCQFLELFKGQGIEVLQANPIIDSMFLGVLEGKLEKGKFQRVDAELADSFLDKERENTILDAEGRTASAKLADLVRDQLQRSDAEVQAKSLTSDELAAFVVIDESTRRQRDAMRQMMPSQGRSEIGAHTFVVNTNHPVIAKLPDLAKKDSGLAKQVVEQLYETSLLSQRELPAEGLDAFLARGSKIMEQLL